MKDQKDYLPLLLIGVKESEGAKDWMRMKMGFILAESEKHRFFVYLKQM